MTSCSVYQLDISALSKEKQEKLLNNATRQHYNHMYQWNTTPWYWNQWNNPYWGWNYFSRPTYIAPRVYTRKRTVHSRGRRGAHTTTRNRNNNKNKQ